MQIFDKAQAESLIHLYLNWLETLVFCISFNIQFDESLPIAVSYL